MCVQWRVQHLLDWRLCVLGVFACSKDCEVLAEKLVDAGIPSAYYHTDMEPGSRAASHSAWSDGNVKVRGSRTGVADRQAVFVNLCLAIYAGCLWQG
jgi:hypothetical protein